MKSVYCPQRPAEAPPNFREFARSLRNPETGKLDKMIGILGYARDRMPQNLRRYIEQKYCFDTSKLPIDPSVYTLTNRIGRGYTRDVFLLKSNYTKIPSWVLKIRHNGDFDPYTLKEASDVKRGRDEICEIFKDVPDLVVPEHTIVIDDLSGKGPIVVDLQPYVDGPLIDVFEGIPRDELLSLAKRNPKLSSQLTPMAEALRLNYEQLLTNQFDLLGKKNLALVMESDVHLALIEPEYRYVPNEDPDDHLNFQDMIQTRFEYLLAIADELHPETTV